MLGVYQILLFIFQASLITFSVTINPPIKNTITRHIITIIYINLGHFSITLTVTIWCYFKTYRDIMAIFSGQVNRDIFSRLIWTNVDHRYSKQRNQEIFLSCCFRKLIRKSYLLTRQFHYLLQGINIRRSRWNLSPVINQPIVLQSVTINLPVQLMW